MQRSLNESAFYLIFVTSFVLAHCSATILHAASTFKSLAELNAAVVSAPLLLVLFEPFSSRNRGAIATNPDIQCSAKCEELLSLCNGAAALPLPKRSRITCGHAQGDKEWMKMYGFLPFYAAFKKVIAIALTCHKVLPECSGINLSSTVATDICWHF
jgi:hypothetical protein